MKRSQKVRPKVLVLGVGNTLYGDDGVGPQVVRNLSRRAQQTGLDFLDGGTGGPGLLSYLEDYSHLVVVDALDAGLEPGTICRFTAEDQGTLNAALSMHQAGLRDLITAARLTDSLPDTVIIGIQAGRLSMGESLSLKVEAQLNRLENFVLAEIEIIFQNE